MKILQETTLDLWVKENRMMVRQCHHFIDNILEQDADGWNCSYLTWKPLRWMIDAEQYWAKKIIKLLINKS